MAKRTYADLVFNARLEDIDKEVADLIGFEEERQDRKLIMIASESYCPSPVREAVASAFANLYAEGHPSVRMDKEARGLATDYEHQMTHQRRFADRRYYKGCEYVNVMENLAEKRLAEIFATDEISADEIFTNVQPLSGAIANNAVYSAFLEPGDTVMGMALNAGGHLTHGSEVNRSGRYYNIIPYYPDDRTGKFDFKELKRLAKEHRPKLVIAGYSAYPWNINWKKFREVADAAGGAILLADMAHVAGLIVGGQFNNPIGYADVVMFTTQKSICGPRGAVLMTTDKEKAKALDRAVFPGEQSGPHLNNVIAKAVCFEIAKTPEFRELTRRIVENAKHLVSSFKKLGLTVAYGGTDSHLLLIDLRDVKTKTGYPLTGEIVARIMELCGIVINKNTIPYDENAIHPSAIRFGTTWVTQRGFGKSQMEKIAALSHRILTNIQPFHYVGREKDVGRGKIELRILEEVRREVDELVREARSEVPAPRHGYPHYGTGEGEDLESPLEEIHKESRAKMRRVGGWRIPAVYHTLKKDIEKTKDSAGVLDASAYGLLEVRGWRARPFLDEVCTGPIRDMEVGMSQRTLVLDKDGRIIDDVVVMRGPPDRVGRDRYIVVTNPQNADRIKLWFRALSDSYVIFDDDLFRKVQGPVIVGDLRREGKTSILLHGHSSLRVLRKLAPELKKWDGKGLVKVSMGKNRVVIGWAGFHEKCERFHIIVDRKKSVHVWKAILDAGKRMGIGPIGYDAELDTRKRRYLPIYGKRKTHGSEIVRRRKDFMDISKPYFVGQRDFLRKRSRKKMYMYEPEDIPPRRSCLYEEHLKLAKRTSMKPFAGWEMPILYTSIADEHRAVRETAGLFDVSHMGVISVQGRDATDFLDAVTTNYVRWLKPCESHYSYVLDIGGHVLDDIFIYKIDEEDYMIVANAVNAEKVFAWLQAVSTGEYLLSREHPSVDVSGDVSVRDLKDPSSGRDRRVDIALQGPSSRETIMELIKDERLRRRFWSLARFELMKLRLGNVPLIISRSGYTGEEYGYELFVHPKNAPKLWNQILEKGKPYGVKPAGLGARDSTRTEAGFPLWGNELAGEHDLFPTEAGYGTFVKLHKSFFVGRQRAVEKARNREREIIRYRMNKKGIRVVRPGAFVVSGQDRIIGEVTSSVVIEGRQLGLALVPREHALEDAEIGMVIPPRGVKASGKEMQRLVDSGSATVERARTLPRLLIAEEGQEE
ncbi:MAG: serine hydroxymethyltransferase [Candidatus Thermoplasmatota archaeon]|nr:serine hydroxymethyltransferase [Candidatus Thermoplasmatota archaeon]